jgi:prepilin-type N-terminal cleavage/methylation domain-containing protein
MYAHAGRKNAGFTLVELMIVVVVIGLLAAIAIPNYVSMQSRAREAGVKSNAHTLQLASEDFAAQNAGIYATDFSSTLPSGEVVLDLLPVPLENPFDPATSAAQDTPPDELGEVGYDSTGLVGVGYVVTGLGRGLQTIITLRNGV